MPGWVAYIPRKRVKANEQGFPGVTIKYFSQNPAWLFLLNNAAFCSSAILNLNPPVFQSHCPSFVVIVFNSKIRYRTLKSKTYTQSKQPFDRNQSSTTYQQEHFFRICTQIVLLVVETASKSVCRESFALAYLEC